MVYRLAQKLVELLGRVRFPLGTPQFSWNVLSRVPRKPKRSVGCAGLGTPGTV